MRRRDHNVVANLFVSAGLLKSDLSFHLITICSSNPNRMQGLFLENLIRYFD